MDKLFQNANDGCTNGIPIGPAVSDLISEVILAAVDRLISPGIDESVLVVRFKDDYRILCKEKEQGRSVVKCLQSVLKHFRLELNDEKTEVRELPDGIFRPWVSLYHSANPRPRNYYKYRRFREAYLAVVAIDRDNPGSGVIDRFLADITTKAYRLRVALDPRSLPRVLSMLLMLGGRRTKAFPKVLAIIESILRSPFGSTQVRSIVEHLEGLLRMLRQKEPENKYLITWIFYFIRANGLEHKLQGSYHFADPIARSMKTSRFNAFRQCGDFRVFQGVKKTSKRLCMLEHLDVFKPQ